MEREDFINTILKSVDGITEVTPSDAIFQRIENQINETTISIRTMWIAVASIIVLVSLNIALLSGNFKSNESEMASLEHSINKNNQLYK